MLTTRPPRSRARLRSDSDDSATPAGIVIAVGAVLLIPTAFLASALPGSDTGMRLAAVAAAVGLFAAWCGDRIAALAVVLLAWLVYDGFLVDRFGVLTWRGWSDTWSFAVLAAAALLGLAAAATGRERRRG